MDLLKAALKDPNKKVRRMAISGLTYLDVPEGRKRKEFVPLIIECLFDKTALVRKRAAFELRHWYDEIPIEVAAMALAGSDGRSKKSLSTLVKGVVGADRT